MSEFRLERAPDNKEQVSQHTRLVVMLGARQMPTNTEEQKFPLSADSFHGSPHPEKPEISGGFARMRALQSMYSGARKEGKQPLFLITSGNDAEGQPRTQEAAGSLVSKYGLPEESIRPLVPINEPHATTRGNAIETADYIRTHREELGAIASIEVVTNDFHALRSWIFFEIEMMKLSTGHDFLIEQEVRDEDKARIKTLLDDGLPTVGGIRGSQWKPETVASTRTQVMQVLRPYFSRSKIHIEPRVVEDTLEPNSVAASEYARRLRSHPAILEALRLEYKGIKDLLDGKYRKKV